MTAFRFIKDCTRAAFTGGSPRFVAWVGSLFAVSLAGVWAYSYQLNHGLIVTGMSDQVSWGIYIANFTFLVGMAAAAVMLVIPAYIFHNQAARSVVLLAEGVAVAACIMCMLFVTVDLGQPLRFWHMIPGLGRLNWPQSMLAWDVIVLSGYLALNISIPWYITYQRYRGRKADIRVYFPAVLISIFWAISIHTVTAFLFIANPARPFWNTALLGPRFIASAFTAGPAFMVLAFRLIDRETSFKVDPKVMRLLALITAISLQINLFMVGVELFKEFYAPTAHSASAQFLFFGIGGENALVPWIWGALLIECIAVVILMVHKLRQNENLLAIACIFAIVGIWIEKGMGLIIPGFTPTPLGEVFGYFPTWTETLVSFGIWAIGFMVFTVLARVTIMIETGRLKLGTLGESQVLE
ncbi:MAG: polysulfide reductase NrfD [Acidobacteria bacterium]|nr:polysulfide reductase NrfD [Acidobacteriota bacterium]